MDDVKPDVEIKRWELDAFVIEVIILSGVAIGGAVGFLARLPALRYVPFYILNGMGFGLMGLLLIPAQSILIRVYRKEQISPGNSVIWSVVGVVVYVVIARLLQ
ncbi:MAG: hypothetical protein ACRD3J_22590 [Thermoanaerobaculia bacterium]